MSPALARRVCRAWGHAWVPRTHLGGRRVAPGASVCTRCWWVVDTRELEGVS
jgi:hypothetical protein